jgi:hypothetical protein
MIITIIVTTITIIIVVIFIVYRKCNVKELKDEVKRLRAQVDRISSVINGEAKATTPTTIPSNKWKMRYTTEEAKLIQSTRDDHQDKTWDFVSQLLRNAGLEGTNKQFRDKYGHEKAKHEPAKKTGGKE